MALLGHVGLALLVLRDEGPERATARDHQQRGEARSCRIRPRAQRKHSGKDQERQRAAGRKRCEVERGDPVRLDGVHGLAPGSSYSAGVAYPAGGGAMFGFGVREVLRMSVFTKRVS